MEMLEPSLHADRDRARRRCREYLLALEEERRKIQVFQRELPLCLDLVTQTIEGMRSQMDSVGSEETLSDHGPVLEEFIPLKPSLSLSSSEEESTHAAAPTNAAKKEEAETPETKKATPDWLQSVQLWSQEPQQSSPNKDLPCKPVALNAKKTGGAFYPFEKEKNPELPASSTMAAASSAVVGDSGDKASGGAFHPFEKEKNAELPASSTTAAASSAVVGDSADKASSDMEKHNEKGDKDVKDKEKDKDKEGQSQPHRKQRRCWAPELHRRFLQALQQLGGSHVATPKQIRELMKVDGLTNDEVKSHLQKYRLHTRRPSSTVQSTAAPPAPQFVVVGGIWVPQLDYAAAATTAAAAAAAAQPQEQLTAKASGSANPVHAPVATLPSGLQPHSQKPSSRYSEGRPSGDTGGASSASPAVSSSSQTTSA